MMLACAMVERALSCDAFWGWLVGLGIGGWILGCALWLWRTARIHYRSAHQIREQEVAIPKLKEGPVILRGVIRCEKPIAMMLRIWQRGENVGGKYPHHLYTEYKRELTSEPFELEVNTTEGLIRLPVEVDTEGALVQLQLPLREESSGVLNRVQIAEVLRGAQLTISGELISVPSRNVEGDGYREVGHQWSLSAKGGVISANLAEASTERFRFFRKYTIATLLIFLALQGVFLFNFYDMALWGQVTPGTVEQLDIVQNRDSKGRLVTHYFVSATLRPFGPEGLTLEVRDRITGIGYGRTHVGDSIPFLFHWSPFHRVQVGPSPTIHIGLVSIFGFGWLIAMMFWTTLKRAREPWWDAALLVERTPRRR